MKEEIKNKINTSIFKLRLKSIKNTFNKIENKFKKIKNKG